MGLSQPSFTAPVSIILHRLPPSYLYGFWSSADMFLQVWPRILLMWEVCTPGLALYTGNNKKSQQQFDIWIWTIGLYAPMLIPEKLYQTISHCDLLVIMNFVICKEKNFWHKTEKKMKLTASHCKWILKY